MSSDEDYKSAKEEEEEDYSSSIEEEEEECSSSASKRAKEEKEKDPEYACQHYKRKCKFFVNIYFLIF